MIIEPHIENRWTALVFGAVFNFLTVNLNETLVEHTLKAIVGGAVWLGFQLIADRMKKSGNDSADKNNEKK